MVKLEAAEILNLNFQDENYNKQNTMLQLIVRKTGIKVELWWIMMVEYTYSSCIFAQNSKCKLHTRITLWTFFLQNNFSFLHLYLSENFHSCPNSLLQLTLSKCDLKVPGFLKALCMGRGSPHSSLDFLLGACPIRFIFLLTLKEGVENGENASSYWLGSGFRFSLP